MGRQTRANPYPGRRTKEDIEIEAHRKTMAKQEALLERQNERDVIVMRCLAALDKLRQDTAWDARHITKVEILIEDEAGAAVVTTKSRVFGSYQLQIQAKDLVIEMDHEEAQVEAPVAQSAESGEGVPQLKEG